MRQPRLRTVLTGAGATLALIGGSTAAYAGSAGPVDSSGVIHGCYKTTATGNSHAVVLQDAGTACPSGYTAIKWNQKGPAGPAGLQGPAGPQGAAGPQGPAGPPGPGASSIETFVPYGTSSTITTINSISVDANCHPPGNPYTDYLTLIPQTGSYDATGWVSLIGVSGTTPELISDFQAGGALQYSTGAGTIDEHVVMLNGGGTAGPVTFDLQLNDMYSGCYVWGTATPST